jgi:hypothetical protein
MIPTTTRRSPVYTGTGAVATYAFAFKVFLQVRRGGKGDRYERRRVDVGAGQALNSDRQLPGRHELTAGRWW